MTALLGMAVLWKYHGWIIFGVLVWLSWKVWEVQVEPRLRDRRLTKRAEEAALQLRADHENRQWLEAGLYEGHYPAPTLPVTYPLVTNGQLTGWHEYTDDYDDGLTEWR
jgi:hypothetical protein